jgi:signal transduction histidine kinase
MTLTNIAVGVALLCSVLAIRRYRNFGLGMMIGGTLAWILLVLAPPVHFKTLPPWLPALPFAVIALTLFVFGFLAWRWGPDR